MFKQFASDVEQVVNKYAAQFGLKDFTHFECSLISEEGEDEFTIVDGVKKYNYRCYGIAAERKDYLFLFFLMSEHDYANISARDMAFMLIGVGSNEVSNRLQGVTK